MPAPTATSLSKATIDRPHVGDADADADAEPQTPALLVDVAEPIVIPLTALPASNKGEAGSGVQDAGAEWSAAVHAHGHEVSR